MLIALVGLPLTIYNTIAVFIPDSAPARRLYPQTPFIPGSRELLAFEDATTATTQAATASTQAATATAQAATATTQAVTATAQATRTAAVAAEHAARAAQNTAALQRPRRRNANYA